MNLIEINPVVAEISGVENCELVVPVNNTLVCHTAFLSTDTRPCVLILMILSWQITDSLPNSPKLPLDKNHFQNHVQ